VLTSRDPRKIADVFSDRARSNVKSIPIEEMDRYSARVDLIVHAASPCDPRLNNASPYRTMTDIIGLTQKAIDLGQRNELRNFVLLSSGAVYGVQPPDLERMSEDFAGAPDLQRTDSCYGEAKRCSELMLVSSGLPRTILRGFSFIGPNQDLGSSFAAPDFIASGFRDGKIVLTGDGRPVRSFCYESDFAIMLLKSLVNGKGRTLNAGNDHPEVTISELATIIAESIGNVKVELKAKATKGLPPRYVPDIDRMRKVFSPEVNLKEGVDRVVRHFRETGHPDPA
jgi:nucleoside-diphosphate-sugar epimerase